MSRRALRAAARAFLAELTPSWPVLPSFGRNAPHYVRDYRRYVRRLFRTHPRDEAAALAVGGGYDGIGSVEADIVVAAGLRPSHSIVDLGCGSGRLAAALGRRFPAINYLGIDVVPELLDYARQKCPTTFRFRLHTKLDIPAEDASADMVVAFSLFTHLLHEESFLYLRDAKRTLRPGGVFLFSFLEFTKHWQVFEAMLAPRWQARRPHLNMFVERTAIEVWAARAGFCIEAYDVGPPIGQSLVVLRNPG